jgi:hypothetical protein
VIELAAGAARQAHRKHRALAGLARHRHVAAHHPCQLAANRKAQAGATKPSRGQRIGCVNSANKLRRLLRRHANAGIRDRNLDSVAAVSQLAHRHER